MPTVTETEIDGYAHCAIVRCPGNTQEKVKAVRRETGHTYRERGGTSPGVESSFVTLHFVDEGQRPCPHCGKAREVSAEARRTYAPLSGHDPMGLLGVPQFNAAKQVELASKPMADPEREALLKQNAELMERLAALEAKVA